MHAHTPDVRCCVASTRGFEVVGDPECLQPLPNCILNRVDDLIVHAHVKSGKGSRRHNT